MNPNGQKLLPYDLGYLDSGKIRQVFPGIEANVDALETLQNHRYHNRNIAKISLIHRSCLVFWPDDKSGVVTNERLEFLGDSFLGFYVALRGLREKPGLNEGALTQLRAALVGTQALARKAVLLGIPNLLLIGKSERAPDGRIQDSILADAFEAILAALLLDAGQAQAELWLNGIFADDFQNSSRILAVFDAKTKFQQWVQSITGNPPEYRVISVQEKENGGQEFVVSALIGTQEFARGVGSSKKSASKNAAELLMKMLDNGELTEEHIEKRLTGKETRK